MFLSGHRQIAHTQELPGWRDRLLFALSKVPETAHRTGQFDPTEQRWTPETALVSLRRCFPDLDILIRNKRVLDYGCGAGFQTVALAKAGAAFVTGVDIDSASLDHARTLAKGISNVAIAETISGTFDIVICLNSFEHFPNPDRNTAELAAAVEPDGKILISFMPWLSPNGSHMYFFARVPWVNLLFSEETVFRVRRLYRDDGATSYAPWLNRMTVRKFERLVADAGLAFARKSNRGSWDLPLVTHIPVVRELLTSMVTCVVVKQPVAAHKPPIA